MPIYEFYCENCHKIFNFLAKTVTPGKTPHCPKCDRLLEKQISIFRAIGRHKEKAREGLADIDAAKMEAALESLAGETGRFNEDDPRQLAAAMRKFTEKSGLNLGEGMEEAIVRLEAGEDPDEIEKDMGERLENDDLFSSAAKRSKGKKQKAAPETDDNLYTM